MEEKMYWRIWRLLFDTSNICNIRWWSSNELKSWVSILPVVIGITVGIVGPIDTISLIHRSDSHHSWEVSTIVGYGTWPVASSGICTSLDANIWVGVLESSVSTILWEIEKCRDRDIVLTSIVESCFPFSLSWESISTCTRSISPCRYWYYFSLPFETSSLPITRYKWCGEIVGEEPSRGIHWSCGTTDYIAGCPWLSTEDDIWSSTSRISRSVVGMSIGICRDILIDIDNLWLPSCSLCSCSLLCSAWSSTCRTCIWRLLCIVGILIILKLVGIVANVCWCILFMCRHIRSEARESKNQE